MQYIAQKDLVLNTDAGPDLVAIGDVREFDKKPAMGKLTPQWVAIESNKPRAKRTPKDHDITKPEVAPKIGMAAK